MDLRKVWKSWKAQVGSEGGPQVGKALPHSLTVAVGFVPGAGWLE